MDDDLTNSKKIKKVIDEIIDKYSRIPYYDDKQPNDYLYLVNSDVDKNSKKHVA